MTRLICNKSMKTTIFYQSSREFAVIMLLRQFWRSTFAMILLPLAKSDGSFLDVSFTNEDGTAFVVNAGDQAWFAQAEPTSEVFVTKDGKKFSLADNSLKPVGKRTMNGSDILGQFESTSVSFEPSDLGFKALVRRYEKDPIIVFTQRFEVPLNGTSIDEMGYETVSTSWPSIVNVVEEGSRRGFISYGGNMAGWTAQSVSELKPGMNTIRGGQLGGPTAFFNEDGSRVILISPLNNFMVANLETRVVGDDTVLDYGLMASVASIPDPFTDLEFIMVGGKSFDKAFQLWGQVLRKYHGKSIVQDPDVGSKYLGYWTDNGAYYYYKTLEQYNYEDTMIELFKSFTASEIPFKYAEIDSWWYFKDNLAAVTDWTAMPDLFPNGLERVLQETGWPIIAHNRYWSSKNVYAKQNGGPFNFVIEYDEYNQSIALPQDGDFWKHLFHEATKWGLEVYEQDWLDVQYLPMSVTHRDFYAARNWLIEMGKGAEDAGVWVKYCMSPSRHVLQSAQITSVNSARVSGDYLLSRDQWRIGISTYMSHALGLAPFKDTFWTSEENPDHPYYYDCMIGSNNTDPNVPWPLTFRYSGYRDKTITGKTCLSWYDLDMHFTQSNDLERNACRNPTIINRPWGEGKPWCFTKASLDTDPSTWEWETCDIPVCNVDCRRGDKLGDNMSLPECDLFREPAPKREAIVALLSTGGVGPGDRIDKVDKDIVMSTCRKDGTLLHPDMPARSSPLQILRMAFAGRQNPHVPHSYDIGEIWYTQTKLVGQWVFPILFFSETSDVGNASWKGLGMDDPDLANADSYVAYNSNAAAVQMVTRGDEVVVPDLNTDEFLLMMMAPVWTLGGHEFALLGELKKISPVSNDRIKELSFLDGQVVKITMEGSDGEVVDIDFFSVDENSSKTCSCTFKSELCSMIYDPASNSCA